MPLSNEDSLRLNVLVAQSVRVIRINESSMVLYALTDRGEARIELSPNTRHEAYLREVRNFLSEAFLDMPGGFPRHIKRWTRMGVDHHDLDKMLLLGEPEAVVALAYSGRLNEQQARDAWWAWQSPEVARNLLKSPQVVDSDLGPELAQFLLEFLPFEAQPLDSVESVRRCLQAGLIDAKTREELWARARRKTPYYVGFLLAGPEAIPGDEPAHADYAEVEERLGEALSAANPFAVHYLHFLSTEGRKWLKTLELSIKKPTEPDIVIALFMAIDQYIELGIAEQRGMRNIEQAIEKAEWLLESEDAPAALREVRDKLDTAHRQRLLSMLVLAQLGDTTLNDIFGGRDASGTVMRKHLLPLTTPINTHIKTLLS